MVLQTPRQAPSAQGPSVQPTSESSAHAVFARPILAHSIFVRAISPPKLSGEIYESGEPVTLKGNASIRLSTQTPMRIIQFRGLLTQAGFRLRMFVEPTARQLKRGFPCWGLCTARIPLALLTWLF